METRDYSVYNEVSAQCSSVLFGGSFAAGIPLCELAQEQERMLPVYNRSIPGLLVKTAKEYLTNYVQELNPGKVFVNLGEDDLQESDFELDAFLEEYEWLLYQIHTRMRGVRLYLVAVHSPRPQAGAMNRALRELAQRCGCEYLSAPAGRDEEESRLKMFQAMRPFLRRGPISFLEAMQH